MGAIHFLRFFCGTDGCARNRKVSFLSALFITILLCFPDESFKFFHVPRFLFSRSKHLQKYLPSDISSLASSPSAEPNASSNASHRTRPVLDIVESDDDNDHESANLLASIAIEESVREVDPAEERRKYLEEHMGNQNPNKNDVHEFDTKQKIVGAGQKGEVNAAHAALEDIFKDKEHLSFEISEDDSQSLLRSEVKNLTSEF